VRALTHRRGALVALLAAALLAGCAGGGMGYYWQSVSGHMGILRSARPVQDWLADARTPDALKARLALSQRIRAFAVDELALPDNPSYRSYADLQRRAAVYNVVAAPDLSLTLQNWCFPVVGCVSYRGYYDEADAKAFAAGLPGGVDVAVYPVPAYSTLGWLNWAGGDPLLSSFIGYPEGELARLIFHELAHQVVFVPGDTVFNESFASAVERLGSKAWLRQASAQAQADYLRFDDRRHAFQQLTLATRARLQSIYSDGARSDADKHQHKAAAMAEFQHHYAELKAGWDGYKGYDAWVARANNASFGAQAAYDTWVPAFEALFERQGRSFPRFYDAVRALARRPPAERQAALDALVPAAQATANTL
jgi:predicted aminopeptidase